MAARGMGGFTTGNGNAAASSSAATSSTVGMTPY
jgi:hypothetical protein